MNKHLDQLLRHINNVQENGTLLAKKIVEQEGDYNFARELIAVTQVHDNSKFYGIEWDFLNEETKQSKPELFQAALKSHYANNFHHVENPFWRNDIKNMTRIFLAEMTCDWRARSIEFGKDLVEWIKDVAMDKYKFSSGSRVYKDIMYFVGLLLEKPFK